MVQTPVGIGDPVVYTPRPGWDQGAPGTVETPRAEIEGYQIPPDQDHGVPGAVQTRPPGRLGGLHPGASPSGAGSRGTEADVLSETFIILPTEQ